MFFLLEIVVRELESHWKLVEQLVHNVQELEEDGREGGVLVAVAQVAAIVESVSERQPLLLYQDSKSLKKNFLNTIKSYILLQKIGSVEEERN